MEKEFKFLPLFISLTAGLVASIIFIIRRYTSIVSLIIVLAVLLVFYVIGLAFRSVLFALKTPETNGDAAPAQEQDEAEADNDDGTQDEEDHSESDDMLEQ